MGIKAPTKPDHRSTYYAIDGNIPIGLRTERHAVCFFISMAVYVREAQHLGSFACVDRIRPLYA